MSETALKTRRGLLLGAGMLAGAAAGGSALAATAPAPKGIAAADFRIARVTAYAISTRDTFDYGGVKKPTRGGATYVEVETMGGLVGHGITTLIDSRGVADLANKIAAPAIKGMNALDNAAVWEKLYWTLSPRGQTGFSGHVMGSIDIALWDIRGKALGAPIATLLGGARQQVPVYVTFGPAFLNREELVAVAKAMVDQGYGALKMVVGDNALQRRDSRPIEAVIREDAERVRAVRQAVGDKVQLYIDGNCSLDLPNAERLVDRIKDCDIQFFEEPLTQNDVMLMAELRRRTGVRLAAGQNEALAFRFRDMLLHEAIDYAQPNVMVGGGYTQAIKIAGMAEAFNIGIESGGAGPLQNLHLHAGVANGGHCEWHLPWMALNRKIYKNMPEPKAGMLAVPAAPGLGFDADPAAIKQYSAAPGADG
ncbi:MAG TPA: mandelate racemase/muconate lactonizing enzyme family protein [Caulobacteraceae bacterium]|jgi:L-alanine-DL-glutamate epimerase-like enolase superfamily enzyme